MAFELGKDQKIAMGKMSDWWDSGNDQEFRLAGVAGSGKSSIIKMLIDDIVKRNRNSKKHTIKGDLSFLNSFLGDGSGSKFNVAWCCPTGKAALVLRTKGMPATTIHKLIYKPMPNPKTGKMMFQLKPKGELADIDMIVIDEASMVTFQQHMDLLSFGKPVVFVGDHFQLPCVTPQEDIITWGAQARDFNLMRDAHTFMNEIHRQAEGNAIIHLATMARNKKQIENKIYGAGIGKFAASRMKMSGMVKADQVLCGFNRTRDELNDRFRQYLGMTGNYPKTGDKLICLKNNYDEGLINGLIGTCPEDTDFESKVLMPGSVRLNFQSEDGSCNFRGGATRRHFDADAIEHLKMQGDNAWEEELQHFDFGYAISVHKAQGSQWDYPILINERFGGDGTKEDDDTYWRWLYTGITRAAERLIILDGKVKNISMQ